MIKLLLNRPPECVGDERVHIADMISFEEVHRPLHSILAQSKGVGLEPTVRMGAAYMELKIDLAPWIAMAEGGQNGRYVNGILQQLYEDLCAVSSDLNRCQMDETTVCIRHPDRELSLLSNVRYNDVLQLLEALSVPDRISAAPLHWRMGDKLKSLTVQAREEIRNAQRPTTMMKQGIQPYSHACETDCLLEDWSPFESYPEIPGN